MYRYYIEEIHAINRDMQEHIDSFHKGHEICTEHPEQNTAHFNNVAKITVDSDSKTPYRKHNIR